MAKIKRERMIGITDAIELGAGAGRGFYRAKTECVLSRRDP